MKNTPNTNGSPENIHDLENEETARKRIEQVRRITEQARQGGLKFEVFLPSSLAEWVLDMVEEGRFLDPAEAVFVCMGLVRDIEAYKDLVQHIHDEILKRGLEEAKEDVKEDRTYTLEELKAHMEEKMKHKREPAIWEKIPLD